MAEETYAQMMDRLRRAAQKAAGTSKPTARETRFQQIRDEAEARGELADPGGTILPGKDEKGDPTRRKKRTPQG